MRSSPALLLLLLLAPGLGWLAGDFSALPLLAQSKETGKESPASDFWSFQPIRRPKIPTPPTEDRTWVRTPIDAFILDTLHAHGLRPSPEASKRVLAARVSLDLTGLPPTPKELEDYLRDSSPEAYEKLVDRLLASPHYGERWARHWLDIAHYADSHGQDQDRFRPNAWPYRDYLIRSFNADKPYARLTQEQIAGDVLFPDNPEALLATGFLAAGPWDESGLRDINENSIDRQVARYLDRDDIVTSTMTTFMGLTVHCARCHDHKFDPISQAEYYGLQAVFAGIDKAERPYDPDPKVAVQRRELNAELERIRSLKGRTDKTLLTPERQKAVAAFEQQRKAATSAWFVPVPETWQAQKGSSLRALLDRSILAVGPTPEKDTYTITLSTDQIGITGVRLELLCDDTLPHLGPGRASNGNLHLSEIRIRVHPLGKPDQVKLVRVKTARADFNQADWGIEKAIDQIPSTAWGIHPEEGKPHTGVFAFEKPVGFEGGTIFQIELDQIHGGGHLIGRFRLGLTTSKNLLEIAAPLPEPIAALLALPETQRADLQRCELSRWLWENQLSREWDSLPPQSRIYCGTNQFPSEGSFRPATTPRPVHILKRGEISRPGALATPAALEALAEVKTAFVLKNPQDEGQRRGALAKWITDRENPLFWRVLVNRIWHYHFGKGIVDTPNDFGKMGGPPSHPELLDWLATEFRDQGGSLKKLHKMIVLSSTYRQAVSSNPEAEQKDADNRLLWRMNRGRLDAESLRDSVLRISGRLDEKMYGPPVKHFLTQPGIHVTPTADYEQFDVDSPEASRRSVYRFLFRTRPDPLLEALDCPDASQSAPVRNTSVSATQALVLWNDKFILKQSEHLAKLAEQSASDSAGRLEFIARRVLLRNPTTEEVKLWGEYARHHGWANLCRVLFNCSEFLFID